MQRILFTALAVFVLATPAHAALTTEHIATDAELLNIIQQIAFVAEGRIGDRGGAATFELDLGPDTGAPATSAQYNWQSSQVEPFTLVYNQGTNQITFSLGGQNLVYTPAVGFEELFVRARAVNSATTVTVQNMTLDGEPVGDTSSADGDGSGLDILRIMGGVLVDGFTLTGDAVLTWTGTPPTQSRLAFQVKVGTPAAVPVDPTTWGQIKRGVSATD